MKFQNWQLPLIVFLVFLQVYILKITQIVAFKSENKIIFCPHRALEKVQLYRIYLPLTLISDLSGIWRKIFIPLGGREI
jgi:hypothetical protein